MRSRKGKRGKGTAASGREKTIFLLHTHDGTAYDVEDNKPVDGDDKEDDDDDEEDDGEGNEVDEDGNAGHVNMAPSAVIQPLAAASRTDITTSKKRKAVEQDGNVAKKVRTEDGPTSESTLTGRLIAGMKGKRVAEAVDTALKKQKVGKPDSGIAASGEV